jgi:hypothetical protein
VGASAVSDHGGHRKERCIKRIKEALVKLDDAQDKAGGE